ncbi:Protein WALLS ARE THIN 1 [Camellia lanceoleosa]|uniref:Protein WALLS ARE THIN 1 n=1 Tax=Camellia lanceoleosa TaxID=1840588 RepID=A0ACC0J4M1_9ERIC|nr:Protein WALLS ARE THIN 1 [Camellia lanceoleosa]
MENSVPAITFLLAAIFRQAPTIYPNPPLHQPLNYFPLRDDEAKNWAVGCVCLIGHCLAWASRIVLQGPIVKKYPTQISLASYTCFFGLVQFLAIAAFLERDLQAWQIHSTSELLAFFYMGFPYPYRYGSLTGEAQSLLQHSCLCKRCSRLF